MVTRLVSNEKSLGSIPSTSIERFHGVMATHWPLKPELAVRFCVKPYRDHSVVVTRVLRKDENSVRFRVIPVGLNGLYGPMV